MIQVSWEALGVILGIVMSAAGLNFVVVRMAIRADLAEFKNVLLWELDSRYARRTEHPTKP